ncbi:ABC transporter ATP-binding protein [Ureibacillus chungkukjangi]|uniref:ABC-2 type transport system ATP-binding protein n=1 Tax=Ureibacillus chungkukjangi TaxID=1202712 RepID=A0A318TME8_9BACL|nr:ABC transporter ATP-binding protein [Ureibacillus chungkukjangi]MCM3388509.1 ABC transporter ATP-binding protein [Ureibacillus chungkukjangi]PYF05824.1 ABC-2 type transport system ATP-binding protein [Ureibacillus chungkukjangi]
MELLRVTNLVKKYGSTNAVNGLSFHIDEGRCVSLLGANGAGKTTTLKMLSGLLEPTSGSISFQGTKQKDIRQYIGYLPQYPSFFNWMSGKEFLVFTAELAKLNRKEAEERSEELLERVGLLDAKKRKIGGYSGGMKQRLGLAQALIHRPKLLILDEPVSALDPLGRREVLDMMREIKQETTVIFSTHVLHDAQEISDDIIIINEGDIAISGELENVIEQYRQPIIQIEFDSDASSWIKEVESYSFVSEVNIQGNVANISVTDMAKGRHILLNEIVNQNLPIRKFELAQTTLEDLFMKVVKA